MQQIKFKGEYFNNCDNAVHIDDSHVQDMIDEVIEELMSLDGEKTHFNFSATGDTLVAGVKWAEDDEIEIIVTQDYYHACLLKHSDNHYEPVNWMKEEYNHYQEMSKEELIDRIKYLESHRAEYNPYREI